MIKRSILLDSGIVKSTSFDSAIPPTQMLDNRIALDKRQLVKRDEKRKPTHGTRGQLAEENDSFQVNIFCNCHAALVFKVAGCNDVVIHPFLFEFKTKCFQFSVLL